MKNSFLIPTMGLHVFVPTKPLVLIKSIDPLMLPRAPHALFEPLAIEG